MGQSERVQAGRGEEAVREASHRFHHVVALQSKGGSCSPSQMHFQLAGLTDVDGEPPGSPDDLISGGSRRNA